MEKGYYWGATAFITITAALTWISLEMVMRDRDRQPEKVVRTP